MWSWDFVLTHIYNNLEFNLIVYWRINDEVIQGDFTWWKRWTGLPLIPYFSHIGNPRDISLVMLPSLLQELWFGTMALDIRIFSNNDGCFIRCSWESRRKFIKSSCVRDRMAICCRPSNVQEEEISCISMFLKLINMWVLMFVSSRVEIVVLTSKNENV